VRARQRTSSSAGGSTALIAAWAAFAFGAAYAAVSAYWGLGGTGLLDTLGGTLGKLAHSASAGALILVWAVAVLKLVAALLPLAAIRLAERSSARQWARALSWVTAATLTVYGLALTGVGLLVQAGVITAAAHADRRALAWHAFLWDPWFLCWGMLVTTAMVASRRSARAAAPPRTSPAELDPHSRVV